MGLPSLLKWYGGKGNLKFKLLPLIPEGGRPYCEPFCGGASILFARKPAETEVLNDLDENLINLFRCFQDPDTFQQLRHRLEYTLYSRAEFCRALEILKSDEKDRILRAWAYFVAMNQSVSGTPTAPGNWSRSFTGIKRGGDHNSDLWSVRMKWFPRFHERLKKIQIDNRDALTVIQYWDNPQAVFYVDPPYHLETRKLKKAYSHEPTPELHQRLVEVLLKCKGSVVLSGYEHQVYQPLVEEGWEKIEISTACHAAVRTRFNQLLGKGVALEKVPRVEVVWRNPMAVQRTRSKHLSHGLLPFL